MTFGAVAPLPTYDVDITPQREPAKPTRLVEALRELDLVLLPAGELTHDGMLEGALHLDLDGLQIDVASLADVITSKAAANRAEDRAALPVRRALLARTAERG